MVVPALRVSTVAGPLVLVWTTTPSAVVVVMVSALPVPQAAIIGMPAALDATACAAESQGGINTPAGTTAMFAHAAASSQAFHTSLVDDGSSIIASVTFEVLVEW
jgi:hypothetical protein